MRKINKKKWVIVDSDGKIYFSSRTKGCSVRAVWKFKKIYLGRDLKVERKDKIKEIKEIESEKIFNEPLL